MSTPEQDRHITEDGRVFEDGEYSPHATEREQRRRAVLAQVHKGMAHRWADLQKRVPGFLDRLAKFEDVPLEEIAGMAEALGCEFNIAMAYRGR